MTAPKDTAQNPVDTRERLLRAAAEAFNRDGYLGTDSNRIAREAGFSPATFYKHFEDKRAALLAAHQRFVGTQWEAAAEMLARPASGRESAKRLVQHFADTSQRSRGILASLQVLAATDAEARAALAEQRSRVLEVLQKIRGGRAAAGRRERDVLLVFALERAAEVLAAGEERDLKTTQRGLLQELQRLIEQELAS